MSKHPRSQLDVSDTALQSLHYYSPQASCEAVRSFSGASVRGAGKSYAEQWWEKPLMT